MFIIGCCLLTLVWIFCWGQYLNFGFCEGKYLDFVRVSIWILFELIIVFITGYCLLTCMGTMMQKERECLYILLGSIFVLIVVHCLLTVLF